MYSPADEKAIMLKDKSTAYNKSILCKAALDNVTLAQLSQPIAGFLLY